MKRKNKNFKHLKNNMKSLITTVAVASVIASCHPGKQDNIVDEVKNSPDTAALVQQIGEKINFGTINTQEQEQEFSKLLADSVHYRPLLDSLHIKNHIDYQSQIQGTWNQITNTFLKMDSLIVHLENGRRLTAEKNPKVLRGHLTETEHLYQEITAKFEETAREIDFFRKHFGVTFGDFYKLRIDAIRAELETGPLKSEYAKLGKGFFGGLEDMQFNLLENYRRRLLVIEGAMFN